MACVGTGHQRHSRTFADDDSRWAAVARRDRGADGAFVYAVRTTGVYCRPGCGAPLARREHVRFFANGAEAERAGFRACKRCRPAGASPAEERLAAVVRACRLIETEPEPPHLDVLARTAGMSPFHFHRVFKATIGVTPLAYIAARRAERARSELRRAASVTQALYSAGFGSSARFYAAAPLMLGMAPTRFRHGGPGASIRFAIGACSLGAILVAATEKGICAISLGDDPEALLRDLQDRFPRAELIGADAHFERWVATVVGCVEAPARGLDLPLDLRGTAFQRRVWQALQDIPTGAQVSYQQLAARIGAPHAARAVAAACAANPVAVAIPCHRVVRSDGSVSGYRWGIERKQALLEREARAVAGADGRATGSLGGRGRAMNR